MIGYVPHVGDRVQFRSASGLLDELLIEQVTGNLVKGRGITIVPQQIVAVIERA